MFRIKDQITEGSRIESPCERMQVRLDSVRSALLIQSGSASVTQEGKKGPDLKVGKCLNM